MWSWFLYVLQDILKEVVKVLLVVLEASFFAHTWKPFQGFYYREPFGLEKPFWPLSPTTSPSLPLLLPSASWKATTQPLSVDHVNQRKMHPLDLRGSGISTRTILLSISTTRPIMIHNSGEQTHNNHILHVVQQPPDFWTKTCGQVWGKGERLQVCPTSELDTPS